MVTINQVEKGILDYVSKEILPTVTKQADAKKQGLLKWGIGAGTILAMGKLEKVVNEYKNHPIVKSLGIVDDAGNVDIDTLYFALKTTSEENGKAVQNIPFVGNIEFDTEEIDKLFEYIKRS